MNQTALQAFEAKYPGVANGDYINLNQTTGNDSTCAVNTSLACATWNEAVRQKTAGIVYVTGNLSANGGDVFGYRYVDAGSSSGTIPKLIVCNGPPCYLRVTGDVLATNTWTAVSGYSNMYSTPIACYSADACGQVNTVLYQDGTLDGPNYYGITPVDNWGNQFPSRLYSTYPPVWADDIPYKTGQSVWYTEPNSPTCYTAIANSTDEAPTKAAYWNTCAAGSFANGFDNQGIVNLATLGEGWYFSIATSRLYVKLGGANLTNPSQAARIRATYYELSNQPARVFVYGTQLCLMGFYLDGVQFEDQEYYDGTKYHPSELWAQNDTIFGASGNGLDLLSSDAYAQNIDIYAVAESGAHAQLGADATQTTAHQPIMEIVQSTMTMPSDPETYAWPGGPVPTVAGHPITQHDGYLAVFGTVAQYGFGTAIAATSGLTSGYDQPAQVNIQWLVGDLLRDNNPQSTILQSGIQGWGYAFPPNPSQQLSMYLDTDTVQNGPYIPNSYPVLVQDGANCFTYNLNLDGPIGYSPSPPDNPCQSYNPSAP